MPKHNIPDDVDITDGGYTFSTVPGETLGELRAKTEMERNVELRQDFEPYATIDRQAEEIARLKAELKMHTHLLQ